MAAEVYVTGMDRIDWKGSAHVWSCASSLSLRKAQCMAGVGGGGDAWAAQETHGQHRQRWR